MKTVYRPLTPLDFVWSDLLAGLLWFVERFGGLTAMLARDTVYSSLRVIARRKLRDLEAMLRALLVVEAANLRLAAPTKSDRGQRPTQAQDARPDDPQSDPRSEPPCEPRDDPDHPERWRATFGAPRPYSFTLPVPDADASGAFAIGPPSFAPLDLAPMARRLEAIRRVLADLPGHARRWVRFLPEIFFAHRPDPRTRAARESLAYGSHTAARDHGAHALFQWKQWRLDTS